MGPYKTDSLWYTGDNPKADSEEQQTAVNLGSLISTGDHYVIVTPEGRQVAKGIADSVSFDKDGVPCEITDRESKKIHTVPPGATFLRNAKHSRIIRARE